MAPPGGTFLDLMPEPAALPGWLTEADLGAYAADYERTGFTGGLNWHRTISPSWELMAPWQGAPVTPPALYVAGARDLAFNLPGMGDPIAGLRACVPNLAETAILPGCGHWTQQERPEEVNAALLRFLAGLKRSSDRGPRSGAGTGLPQPPVRDRRAPRKRWPTGIGQPEVRSAPTPGTDLEGRAYS